MKILKALPLEKYEDSDKYELVEGLIYKNKGNEEFSSSYCVTLYCELEDDEDTEYPLEDLLDKYLVYCTDFIKEEEIDGKHIFTFEIEGEDLASIKEIFSLVGKRVFNYEEGDYIKLGIE